MIGWSIESRTSGASVCVALHLRANEVPVEVATKILLVLASAVAHDGADSDTIPASGLSRIPWPRGGPRIEWRTAGSMLVAEIADLGSVGFIGDRRMFGELLCSAFVGLRDGSTPPAIGMDAGAYDAIPLAPGGGEA